MSRRRRRRREGEEGEEGGEDEEEGEGKHRRMVGKSKTMISILNLMLSKLAGERPGVERLDQAP